MSDIDRLIRIFQEFPGVGVRQARRFVHHILTLPEAERTELAHKITELRSSVSQCVSCRRYFTNYQSQTALCKICDNTARNHQTILVVAHDSDIDAIEKSDIYNGIYFVLGGTVPLLKQKDSTILRGRQLTESIKNKLETNELEEVILGFPYNPDGENTARYVRTLLTPLLEDTTCTITQLGRGLSTGSEIEYADPDTISYAITNRIHY